MSNDNMSKGKGKVLKRADPSTIQDKFMVGYQGWFTCAGDGEPVGPGHHGWLHWFNYPIPDGGRPNTDLWPDVSSYSPSELFPAPGLKTKAEEQTFLFSSRHPKTVQRHFHWMAEHGIDGAFLQRFAGQCDLEAGNEGIRRIRDEVGDRVKESAEKEGRVFAIMYDVSGVAPDRVQRVLERDWIHLIREKGVLDSPNYLREKGKPVIALWGFGFENAGHSPELVRAITNYIRNVTPGGAYIMAGTPAHWRTADSDADRNPGFLDVWLNEFDAISPWTVGRYRTEQDADDFAETKMKGDVDLIKKRNEEGRGRKIDYIPVVLPGGSGFNLSEGKWGYNDIKREGGRFLWKQIFNAKRQGVRIIYGAMWDEYDEGTAFMPVVEKKRMLPESDKYPFMALDEDGYDLPSDWYMRICGFAAEGLRSERRIHETFPSKELQDYWASRPKYEDVDLGSGGFVSGSSEGGTGSGDGQTYQDWLASQKSEDKDEPPPPPYSLEADEGSESHPQAAVTSGSAAPQPIAIAATAPTSSTPSSLVDSTSTDPSASASLVPANPQPQAPGSTGPPPINSNSRPEQLPGTSAEPPPSSIPQDSVTSLASDFNRHSISPPTESGRTNLVAPPPLHPTHPAVLYGQIRPQSSHSRPHLPSSPSPVPPLSPASQQPGSWSQGQWPPPEWGFASQQQNVPPHQSSYPGQVSQAPSPAAGASLSRPHTITASSYISPPSVRPYSPSNGPSSRPAHHHRPGSVHGSAGALYSTGMSPQPPRPSSSSSYSPPLAGSGTSGYGSMPSSHSHNAPSFPSGATAPYPPTSSYVGQGGSTYPGQSGQVSQYTPGHNYHIQPSPPHSPTPGSSYGGPYTGQGISSPYNSGQASSYPGQPYTTTSYSPPVPSGYGQGPNEPAAGLHFPQAHSGEYFNIPQPQQSSYSPGYVSQENSGPYQGPSHQTLIPAPAPGGWYPGSLGPSMAPPMPPRPSSHSPSPYSQPPSSGLSFPAAATSAGTGALGLALSAVDKVAGKKTRTQIESGVGSLAQTGSKLFNKFTK